LLNPKGHGHSEDTRLQALSGLDPLVLFHYARPKPILD
jgi:hypothetical protein